MRILHVTGEIHPYSATGGLGFVLAELPPAQRAAGVDARVITPLYGHIDKAGLRPGERTPTVHLGGRSFAGRLWYDDARHITFVDLPGLLDRPHNYGGPQGDYADNPLRFGVFCRIAASLWSDVDVFHLHDWQAGLTSMYLGGRRPVVLTVHNLAYQGLCGFEWADRLGIPHALRTFEGVEYYGRVSLLKAGLVLADRLTTVSPTYAREIQTEPLGQGLAGLFRHRRRGLEGILNGVGPAPFDPATGATLAARYDAADPSGKAACRAALLAELGLDDGPVFGVVGRAAHQKGFDLLMAAAPAAIQRGARFAVVASGDRRLVAELHEMARHHPKAFAYSDAFDIDLAQRVYAGSDFVVVPSRFEPCGLVQMIAMRYGSIPVVRRTGGLADTVADGETGIVFDAATPQALFDGLKRAMALDAPARKAIQARGMARDWSWTDPARAYADIYARLIGQPVTQERP